jgi:hypothetical protein
MGGYGDRSNDATTAEHFSEMYWLLFGWRLSCCFADAVLSGALSRRVRRQHWHQLVCRHSILRDDRIPHRILR